MAVSRSHEAGASNAALMMAQMQKRMGAGQAQQAQGISAASGANSRVGANQFAQATAIQHKGPQIAAGAGQSKGAQQGGGDQLAQFKQNVLPNVNLHKPAPSAQTTRDFGHA